MNDRIDDCRELFLRHNGQNHELIEQEMRRLGHADFHRRCLYRRYERGRATAGWIERYGWARHLKTVGNAGTPALKSSGVLSPKWPKIIARAQAEVRHPGYAAHIRPDPEGVEQHPRVPADPAREDYDEFLEWLKKVTPTMTWDAKHQLYIYKYLRRVTAGLCRRLMIFMPPRHGKSELVTVRYAAWRLKRDPSLNVIIGSYAQKLANRFSRKIRRVLADDAALLVVNADTFVSPSSGSAASHCGEACLAGHTPNTFPEPAERATERRHSLKKNNKEPHGEASLAAMHSGKAAGCQSRSAFRDPQSVTDVRIPTDTDRTECPFPFISKRPKNTEAEWETSAGGSLKAVGTGAGVTGFGADLIIVDDPIKSREQAESQTCRDKVWEWFNDDLYTRLEPNGSMILIQTRWHEDDLAGRLLKKAAEDGEHWDVISLPALAETIDNGQLIMDNEKPIPVSDNSPFSILNSQLPKSTVNSQLPKRQLYYTVRGRRIPVHTLGNPNAKRRTADIAVSPDPISDGASSPKGTKILAQGKAEGRHPGYAAHIRPDPEGVKQPAVDVAPLQGANCVGPFPGVPLALLAHPRLLSVSPSATKPNGIAAPDSLLNSPLSTASAWRDVLGRRHGEPLWSARFGLKKLEALRLQLGSYSFAALYQQRPAPAEGGMFKRAWFANIVSQAPHGLKWTRGYDLGISAKTTADYTASLKAAFDKEGNLYIDGGFRSRIEYPEQRRYILGRIAAEPDTQHGIELSANGNAVIQDLRREPAALGRALRGIKPRGDKFTRALGWMALAEAGKVFLVRGPWNDEFIHEACTFPQGTHDDQIDAVSIAVQMHRERKNTLHVF